MSAGRVSVMQVATFASGARLQLARLMEGRFEIVFRERVVAEADTQFGAEAEFRRAKRNIEREGRP